jgi:hypothetical protein
VEEKREQQNQFNGSTLNARIEAQLEVYGKVQSDYSVIIAILNNLISQFDELRKTIKEDHTDIIIDINKIIEVLEVNKENTSIILDNTKHIIDRQQGIINVVIENLKVITREIDDNIKESLDKTSIQHREQDRNLSSELSNIKNSILNDLNRTFKQELNKYLFLLKLRLCIKN